MSASDLWRGWQNLAKQVWPASEREQTQDEIARLDGELRLLYARLVKVRQRIDAARGTEKAARLEAIYARQRERLQRRKRLRRDLATGRLVVVDVTHEE
jgi:hypothetical protein